MRCIGLIIALAVAWPMDTHARSVRAAHSEIELLSEHPWVESGPGAGPSIFAIRLKPEPGWHTYWKNPGDSGLPLKLDWSLPPGFNAAAIQWPVPEILATPPLRNFGYEKEIFLLVEVWPTVGAATQGELKFSAVARWLVCKDVCLPAKADLSITLPVRAKTEAKRDFGFQHARARIPNRAATGEQGWRWDSEVSETGVRLFLTPPPKFVANRATFFPTQSGLFEHASMPPGRFEAGRWIFDLPRVSGAKLPMTVGGVVATDIGAFEIAVAVNAKPEKLSLLQMLWFAFIGGLLLNLMPCVFPILSLKLLAFGRETHREAVRDAAFFGLGTLVFLWALVAILVGLRASGQALGWGFQLQSPGFVGFLAFLFTALALNLLGVFEIGGRWMGWGGKAAAQGGAWGSFFTGALNVLVATPCTAPFMGIALGFALSGGAVATFAIFTALGLGMLAPYFAVASMPRLQKKLPRPGAWMETFRQLLAFPLFATVIWLVWTWGRITGHAIPVRALGALLAGGFIVWLVRKRRAFGIAATVIGLIIVAGSWWSGTRQAVEVISWQTYSPEKVAQDVAHGLPVFIDFTAAWCVSCQVNERVALRNRDVVKRFRELGIRAYLADWTTDDPMITHALESYGRNAVPLYVLYLPSRGSTPIFLPEILTPGIVLGELSKK